MEKIRVAVVLGGRSVEHAVSCGSAAGVLSALDPDRFEVTAVGITTEGQWVTVDPEAKLAIGDGQLPEITAGEGNRVSLVVDPTVPQLDITDATGGTAGLVDVDVVFPVMHGPYGEDGTIQGLLEMAGLPYVGSGVLSSALCMDKEVTKRLLAADGIPIGEYAVLRGDDDLSQADRDRLGLPVFVKPARAGSSLGITRVTDWDRLPAALAEARRVDPRKVLVEAAFVGARELECGVLADEDGGAPATTPPLEVLEVGSDGWFDFEAKYLGSPEPFNLSPDLPTGVAERVRDLAARTFTVLECSDLARVDFFLGADGTVYVNEINTMPGLTPMSGVPQAWAAAGLSYPDLVAKLVRMAVTRGTGMR